MQFKNPEILYFLILLLVPILVHLFQLQKYKKVVFTNVAFLQKISQQTRKSSRLKKWLILLIRLLLFLGLIFAFSQPYFPAKNFNENNDENWIYLDNSISLNSKGKSGDLLQHFSQEILERLDQNSQLNLITNDEIYKNISKRKLSSTLKNTPYSPKKIGLQELFLKITSNKTNSLNKLVLISDFQNYDKKIFTDVNSEISLISDQPQSKNNVSIDSLFVKEQTSSNITLQIFITNHGEQKKNLSFSLLVNKKLNNKQSVSIEKKESKSFDFTFQKTPYILGEIRCDFQDTFLFDNHFFFTLDFRTKIKVLSIGKNVNYISKIFSSDEFEFTSLTTSQIDYNQIPKQQFIILNEIDQISSSLKNVIKKFVDDGGNLLIIPSQNSNMNSYNQFFQSLQIGRIIKPEVDSLQVTQIAFDHPIFSDVFSKRVQNFEYPSVFKRFISSFQGNPVLSFANQNAFLEEVNIDKGTLFWFSSPINPQNSNFTRSPLIVPTLYNLAFQSSALIKTHYFAGKSFDVKIPVKLKKDEVLNMSFEGLEFIPLQQSQFNYVNLSLNDHIRKSGFYAITRNQDTLQQIAVNYDPLESTHNYLDVKALEKELNNVKVIDSIDRLFNEISEENNELHLWKLFLTLAIVSLFFEIFILKFFKT